MTQTAVQASVSKTGTFNGSSIDISGITGDWALEITVQSLSAGGSARLTFDDSVDAFTASLPGPVVHVAGTINQPKTFVFTKKDWPNLRFGTASAVGRLAIKAISGTLVYQSFLKY